MNITKDYFETQLRRHDKVTVYSQDNTPLTVSRDFYLPHKSRAFHRIRNGLRGSGNLL